MVIYDQEGTDVCIISIYEC